MSDDRDRKGPKSAKKARRVEQDDDIDRLAVPPEEGANNVSGGRHRCTSGSRPQ
jgi:hypothetical protein